MKRFLALAFAVTMLMVMVLPVGIVATAVDADITVVGDLGIVLTVTGAADKYEAGNAGYGDYVALYFDDDATITFNQDVQLLSMGAPTIMVTGGTTYSIAEVKDNYFYAGADTMTSYYVNIVQTSAPGYYTPSNATIDLVDSIDRASAGSAAPAPAATGGSDMSSWFQVGVWPMAAGSYDPALDGQNIPDGASVYGLFDAMTYATLPNPESIPDHEMVGDIGSIAPGKAYLLIGSSGFNYVIFAEGDSAAIGGGSAAPDAGTTAPAGSADIPDGFDAYYFPGSDIHVGIKSYRDVYYDFDLAAAGFGTGHVYAIYFGDDGEVVFDQGVTLTAYDASFNAITLIATPGVPLPIADVNGFSIPLGSSGNSLCFVQESNPINYSGLIPDKVLADLATTEKPVPLEFKFVTKEDTSLEIDVFDSNEMYGYYYEDRSSSDQLAYLFIAKENGTVTFSKDVTIEFVDMSTGQKNGVTYACGAGVAVPIADIHAGRLYFKNGVYAVFISNKLSGYYIPPGQLNPSDRAASETAYKALAKLSLVDETDGGTKVGKLSPYSVFSGNGTVTFIGIVMSSGFSLLLIVILGFGVAIPMLFLIAFAHRTEVKSGGVKFAQVDFNLGD